MTNSIWRPIGICLFAAMILAGLQNPSLAKDISAEEVRIDVGGFRLNSVLVKASKGADLPAIVFIHGASANLYDPMLSFREKLEGRATMLFVDRPGHGRSDTGGPENILPDGQADAIARLMEKRGIRKAIIVGHSFGGAITAAFALRHPDKVVGLVFLSPAVYPWPGGVAWYYDAANAPISGALFSTILVPPLGIFAIGPATEGVFAPNRRPPDYVQKTNAWQALRPAVDQVVAQPPMVLWPVTFERRFEHVARQQALFDQHVAE